MSTETEGAPDPFEAIAAEAASIDGEADDTVAPSAEAAFVPPSEASASTSSSSSAPVPRFDLTPAEQQEISDVAERLKSQIDEDAEVAKEAVDRMAAARAKFLEKKKEEEKRAQEEAHEQAVRDKVRDNAALFGLEVDDDGEPIGLADGFTGSEQDGDWDEPLVRRRGWDPQRQVPPNLPGSSADDVIDLTSGGTPAPSDTGDSGSSGSGIFSRAFGRG